MLSSLVGLALDNIFTIVFQTGQILMKIGIKLKTSDSCDKWKQILIWLCGFACISSAEIVHACVVAYIDMIMMSTTVGMSVLSGVALSVCWLKEPLQPQYDCPALFIIILGSVLLILLTAKESYSYTSDEYYNLLTSKRSISYLLFSIICVIQAILSQYWLKRNLIRFETQSKFFMQKFNKKDQPPYLEFEATAEQPKLSQNTVKHDLSEDAYTALSNLIESNKDKVVNKRWGTQADPSDLINFLQSISKKDWLTINQAKDQESITNKELKRQFVFFKLLKLPLILMMLASSQLNGLNQTLVKLASTALFRGAYENGDSELLDSVPFGVKISLVIMIFSTAFSILYLVNISMELYRQIDVVPMKESTFLINYQIAGIVLMNEGRFYTYKQMFNLLVLIMFLVTGILILSMKKDTQEKSTNNYKNDDVQEDNVEDAEIELALENDNQL